MAGIAECIAKWSARLVEWRELGVQTSGEKVAAEVIEDLRSLVMDENALTLREASLLGGYSIDHLQRLVARGTITNVGRQGAPRLRRADVPLKPGHAAARLHSTTDLPLLSARRRIVADAQPRKGA